jgi:aspartyl-tRNA(Asn)/glutamyl-tRNA(Gln) amidotransferase subunit B
MRMKKRPRKTNKLQLFEVSAMNYEVIIGIEVHAELSTKSKIFCSCTTKFGGSQNTHTCPICVGMPGVLPVLNRKSVEYAIKAGLATHCTIANFSKLDRKNYFYPDLPKAYQVSQYDLPLCENGHLDISVDGQPKRIGITRIHIEEDAGKLIHDSQIGGTLIDYNRCGIPLIEIVSEPDIRSAEEAKIYVESLKAILEYIDVSDCKMQEGSLRADINLSVRPKGQKELGTRTEMKNLNSFKSIVRAINSEINRQIEEIEDGNSIIQETRRWDDDKGDSYSMRTKEDAHDYRYFPEPDLVPIEVNSEWLHEIKNTLPELPEVRVHRYINDYSLPEYDARILTKSKSISNFFEEAIALYPNPKTISNWIMGELLRKLNECNLNDSDILFQPKDLCELLQLIDANKITQKIAKQVFSNMFETGLSPTVIVKNEKLEMVNEPSQFKEWVHQVLLNHPKLVEDYKNGKTKVLGFFVGQIMKECRGNGDPKIINQLLIEALGSSTPNE